MLTRFLHIPTPPGSAPSGVPFFLSNSPMGGGSFALPFLRTGMFFQNIPVLRSAYWLYQTLGLQVRYTAYDGRGKLRSPLHPSLLPPKNANGRAGGKRTRLGRKRNRARRRRRRYAAAQRTPARRSRARGLPVRGSQGQDGRPRGGPGEPQRPRFALPRLLRHSAYSPIFPAKFLFAEGMRRCCAKFSFL